MHFGSDSGFHFAGDSLASGNVALPARLTFDLDRVEMR
jgi:hypothetical protein